LDKAARIEIETTNPTPEVAMPVPADPTPLAADQLLVEKQLRDLFDSCLVMGESGVHDAMRYAVLGQGQRLRPILALRTARVAGIADQHVLRAAAAVELLHCASLVIDDLPSMDNELLRRNRPTVHVAFGEATAVLAGFALVALAARSVVDRTAPAERVLAQLEFQDRLLGMLDCSALIAGQAMDLRLGERGEAQAREKVNQLKTVPLFELSVRAGLLGVSTTAPQYRTLLQFGWELGAAYQAVDDYLDGHATDAGALEPYALRCRACLEELPQDTSELEGLLNYIHAKAWQEDRCHR
jgi:farnesyl diphosphate synthase